MLHSAQVTIPRACSCHYATSRRSAVNYCHTFENRSSLAPNSPAGLALPPPPPLGAAGPVLLDHPPYSSSAATFGAPACPITMGLLANELLSSALLADELPAVPQPKSLLAPVAAGLVGTGVLTDSEASQTLPPHTSELDRLLGGTEPRGFAEGVNVVADAG